MGFQLEEAQWREHGAEGAFGLEKESLRVDSQCYLSRTPHPFPGDRQIDRDFCENQVELITDVCSSVSALMEALTELHGRVVTSLLHLPGGPEYLWPFSSPPRVLREEEIPVARFIGSHSDKRRYREYLASRYGKWKMLFSGIHFNFSFSERLLRADFLKSGLADYQEYKNHIYLELGKKITKYSWLIVYLTAASPILDPFYGGLPPEKEKMREAYASPRCSEIGYWNEFTPIMDYSGLEAYVDGIVRLVREGKLKAPSELYYPVRLKPRGKNSLEALRIGGVDHIELRMLDLNPLSPVGIDQRDLEFIYQFILYLMRLPDEEFTAVEQADAIYNMKQAALYEEQDICLRMEKGGLVGIRRAALQLLDEMEASFGVLNGETFDCLSFQREKVENPDRRYAVQVRRSYGQNYMEKGLSLARNYGEEMERRFLLYEKSRRDRR
ncbi:MAG: hypothetical protein LUF78_10960 [Clostridiales bacterium]|nr:hypothetical protein [Clostridiales bacterium]